MNGFIYRKYVIVHINLAAKVTLCLQTKQKYLPLHICMSEMSPGQHPSTNQIPIQ